MSTTLKDLKIYDAEKNLIQEQEILNAYNKFKQDGKRKIEKHIITAYLKEGRMKIKTDNTWQEVENEDDNAKLAQKMLQEFVKQQLKPKKQKQTQGKGKSETEHKMIAGEDDPKSCWRGILSKDYNNFVNEHNLQFDDIKWLSTDENDYRQHSIKVITDFGVWTVYDWNNEQKPEKSNIWFIAGTGNEEDLQKVVQMFSNKELEKHPKEPGTLVKKTKAKKQPESQQETETEEQETEPETEEIETEHEEQTEVEVKPKKRVLQLDEETGEMVSKAEMKRREKQRKQDIKQELKIPKLKTPEPKKRVYKKKVKPEPEPEPETEQEDVPTFDMGSDQEFDIDEDFEIESLNAYEDK